MKTHTKHNKRIIQLWVDQKELILKRRWTDRIPFFYPSFGDGKVLFVGSNPSYKGKEAHPLPTFSEFLSYDTKSWRKIINETIKRQQEAHASHPYYKGFINLVGDNFKWEHTDLLAIRETNEGRVKKFIGWKKKRGVFECKKDDFVRKQLKLWESLVHDINPSLIVVASAFARDMIKWAYGDDCSIPKNQELPLDKLLVGKKKYDIVFMGMLSGRRAMDTGSQRLWAWYIPQLLSGGY